MRLIETQKLGLLKKISTICWQLAMAICLYLNSTYFHRNRNRRTPLDVAALNGHAKVVELLMTTISECHPKSFLCNLVNPSDEHDSPLHLAITHGHLEVVLVLVKREAKVYLVNHDSKKTPLQVAIEYKHE